MNNHATLTPFSLICSLFLWLLLSFFSTHLSAQIQQEKVNSPVIKTIQLFKSGSELSIPIINLGSSDMIALSFDELSLNNQTYSYAVYHCSANWELSRLMPNEYLNGFHINQITNYQYSFNTSTDYIHYSVEFPNSDFSITKSGNYIVKVFKNQDEDSPILVKRFYVLESLVGIVPEIRYPFRSEIRETMQQVNFKITHPNFRITNPMAEIKTVVHQNLRTDNIKADLKPVFIRNNELIYEFINDNLFEGGNEFRWMDIRSTRFLPEYIADVTFQHPFYHVTLKTDIPRQNTPYFYREDSNGKQIISVREYDRPWIEADYLFVHFSLYTKSPFLDSQVYLIGGITNWKTDLSNQMVYDPQNQCYELSLLLKQGFYNYQYGIIKNETNSLMLSPIEGSFSQTENDYTIYCYYRGMSDFYDRLIGFTTINSLTPKTKTLY